MKIIGNEYKFSVYNNDVVVMDKLKPGTYEAKFTKIDGFYLKKHTDLSLKEPMYGNKHAKVKKILGKFGRNNRNLGVILYGQKGSGKTMFACDLIDEAKQIGIPTILVNDYYDGICDFIHKIDQECVVFFDEFEKFYGYSDEGVENERQSEFLTFLDGTSDGKRLFVISCNSTDKLSSYFIDRPGRFHYKINFGEPTYEDIRAYLDDNLNKKYSHLAEDILLISMRVIMTYDMLRAVCEDVNDGIPLKEVFEDINISTGTIYYKYNVYFDDGEIYSDKDILNCLDEEIWLEVTKDHKKIIVDLRKAVPFDNFGFSVDIDKNSNEYGIKRVEFIPKEDIDSLDGLCK